MPSLPEVSSFPTELGLFLRLDGGFLCRVGDFASLYGRLLG
jgi:hypothetical protein